MHPARSEVLHIPTEGVEVNGLAYIAAAAPRLAHTPLLVLSADDGLAGMDDVLVADMRRAGGTQVKAAHVATDHSCDDQRIWLGSEVVEWLATLPGAPRR